MGNEISVDNWKNGIKKEIYSSLWVNKKCNYNIEEIGKSDHSYAFEISDGNGGILKNDKIVTKNKKQNEINKELVCKQLSNIFQIKNKEIFKEKFMEVCSGSGGEAAKITTLHSSSLCALLFFYNINTESKMTLCLNGKDVEFDEVHFEFKNNVTKKGGPSNMDVVLVSNSQQIILFLESKFSEYLTAKSTEVRYEYINEFGQDFYNENFLKSIHMQIINDKKTGDIKRTRITKKGTKEEYFVLAAAPNRPACYAEGIKQMISHYIGVTHFKDGNLCAKEKRSLNHNYSVYLGEILFDFDYEDAQIKFSNYEEHYKVLKEALQEKNPNINMLETPLKYSTLKKKCEDKVNFFYYG